MSVNNNVNNKHNNETTTAHENHTQRQVSRQGNGINGKETKRNAHVTNNNSTEERREREKVKTHKPTRRTNVKQHTKPIERERKTEKPAMSK